MRDQQPVPGRTQSQQGEPHQRRTAQIERPHPLPGRDRLGNLGNPRRRLIGRGFPRPRSDRRCPGLAHPGGRTVRPGSGQVVETPLRLHGAYHQLHRLAVLPAAEARAQRGVPGQQAGGRVPEPVLGYFTRQLHGQVHGVRVRLTRRGGLVGVEKQSLLQR
ncbi:hypothetical protein GCM10022222_29780 [Amycolatopsis ultiminotia]|uniref:Uncharacterized protein n=1 Tax=Amycolatopsis ultiminotia TaxID=543629 RepID=A0ABP6W411_9PSEU